MKTIHLVAAHYGVAHFTELVRTLGDSPIFAHVDLKADQASFALAAGERAAFVPQADRVNVRWGGWSQVQATLALLRSAAPHIEPDDYVILISGDTYPLQSADNITAFLKRNQGTQFINSVQMPSIEASKPLTRLSNLYLEYDPRNGRRNILPKVINRVGFKRNYQKALSGRTPYAGSTWWALTGEACKWLLAEVERDPEFVKFCRYTKMPDEFFFQTLLGNSPFREQMSRTLMFADWTRPNGPKPAILDEAHIAELMESGLVTTQPGYGSGPVLYGRKVTSRPTMEAIESKLWPLRLSA